MTHADKQRQLILSTSFPIIAVLLLNGFWLEPLFRSSPLLFWMADLGSHVVVPTFAVLVLRTRAALRPRDYGFCAFERELSPLAVVGMFAFVALLYWIFYNSVRDLAYGYLWQSAGSFGYGEALPTWGLYRVLAVAYLALTAAVVEEAVFRSLPWLYFSLLGGKTTPIATYVLSTSILFGAVHWEQGPHGVIAAFSVGVIAAQMYAKLQNIWPFVGAHFLTDLGAFT